MKRGYWEERSFTIQRKATTNIKIISTIAHHLDLSNAYNYIQKIHAHTIVEHSSLTITIQELHLGLHKGETLYTTTKDKCEDIKVLIEGL